MSGVKKEILCLPVIKRVCLLDRVLSDLYASLHMSLQLQPLLEVC